MINEIAEILQTQDNFLITAHINPEGDSVGSVFALDEALRALGKQTMIVCQDAIPPEFAFLHRSWLASNEVTEPLAADWAVVLDSPTRERIGTVANCIRDHNRMLVIDHHISNTKFGRLNWVEPHASSCCEMIFTLCKHMRIHVPPEMARLIYIGISTDTGSFRYQNASAETHRIVAELIDIGIDLAELNEHLYSNVSLARTQLRARLFDKLQFAAEGQIAWSVITDDDIRTHGARVTDAEGFVEQVRDIEGVRIAFLLRHIAAVPDIAVSLRSRQGCDVNRVAHAFGGGGHAQAAGCTMSGSVDDVVRRIVAKAKEQLKSSE